MKITVTINNQFKTYWTEKKNMHINRKKSSKYLMPSCSVHSLKILTAGQEG